MKTVTKKQLQKLTDYLNFPTVMYIYETGRVVAVNGLASDIFGCEFKNIKQLLHEKHVPKIEEELLHNGSKIVYGYNLNTRKNNITLDCEVNCIELEDQGHLIFALFDYSYKQCFIRSKNQKVPRVVWKNRKLEYLGLNIGLKEDYELWSQKDYNEKIPSILEENTLGVINKYEQKTMNSKEAMYEAYQMISFGLGKNFFVKLHCVPLTNRYGTAIGIIDVAEMILNREEYKHLYDQTIQENDLLSEVVSQSEFIIIRWVWNEVITVDYVSSNIRNLGFNIEDLYNGKTQWKDVFFPKEYRGLKKFVKNINDWPDDIVENEFCIKTPNDKVIWLHAKTVIIRKKGKVSHYETIVNDITENMQLREKLDESNRALEMNTESFMKVFDNLNSYMFVINRQNYRLMFVNKKVVSQYGFFPINQKIEDFFRLHDIILYHSNRKYSNEYLEECIENKVSYITFYDREHKLLLDAQMSNVEWRGAKNAIVIHMHDITEMVSSGRSVKFTLDQDYLTGLHNQKRLDKDLDILFERTHTELKKYYFFYIDLDDFNRIQNTLGEEYTNLLLKKVANHFLQLQEIRDYCYRVAGDKYYIFADYSIGEEIKNKIYAIFQKSFQLNDEKVSCTASIGIALLTPEIQSKRELFEHVKMALNDAKEQGRNRVCYYKEDEQDKSNEHLIMEEELIRAVNEGCEEFKVYFQPIIDTMSETIIGVEAFAVWENGKLGRVKPKYYVPVAESLGIMPLMGKHLMEQAFRASLELQNAGYNIKVHVNLSDNQVSHPGFVNQTLKLADDMNIKRENIVYEITECFACENKRMKQENFKRMHKEGFLLTYDRFMGAVFLNDLLKIPFSYVKLSKSFLEPFGTKEFNLERLSSMIRFIHAMDSKAIIMGIETKEQKELAVSLGVDMMQGYYYGNPIELERLIESIKVNSQKEDIV